MKRYLSIVFICLVIISSCSLDKENNFEDKETKGYCVSYTIKERDSRYPLNLDIYKRKAKKSPDSSEPLSLEKGDYLGCSYRLDNFPLGTSQNIGIPIINMKKLKKQESIYVTEREIGQQTATAFSYSDFNRYANKSKETEKINSGIKLNLGIFSIGSKKTMESIFTNSIINENKRIFGELNVEVLAKRYAIEMSPNLQKKITFNYIYPEIKEEMYTMGTANFIESFGPLVLTGFHTGGRVTAMYTGHYKSNHTTETMERNMDQDISASFGTNGEGSFGLGGSHYKETETSYEISDMKISVKSIGGNLSFTSFSAPKDIASLNVDLGGWINSMSSETSYQMIDIIPKGLHLISDFFLERNILCDVQEYLSKGELPLKEIREPYIEITRRDIQGLTFLVATLMTKRGDRILLAYQNLTPVSEELKQQYIQSLTKEKSEVYGLKIIYTRNTSDVDPVIPSLTYELGFYHETLLKKYIDEKNNMLYLLYDGSKKGKSIQNIPLRAMIPDIIPLSDWENPLYEIEIDENGVMSMVPDSGKYGFSIYNYEKTLDLYGLTDFVNKLPTIQVDDDDLFDYTLILL